MTDQRYVNLLNQHASLLLRQAHQQVDRAPAPLFQLMEWGKPQLDLQYKYRDALQETLQNLQSWPNQQGAAMSLLKQRQEDGGDYRLSLQEFQQEKDPLRASESLWQVLHSKLGVEKVSYHRADV